jgi:hypothetical protein
VHPFSNGNGRWARLLAIAVAARMESVWSAATLLTLYANHEDRVVSAWGQARNQGWLGSYLDECEAYQARLKRHLDDSPFVDSARALHTALVELCGMRDADVVFCTQINGGNLDQEKISSLLGCSRKKSKGVFEIIERFLEMNADGFGASVTSSAIESFRRKLSTVVFFR